MFLLKGHEDLRQDERVMQLFGLVNSLLLNTPETFRRNLTYVSWLTDHMDPFKFNLFIREARTENEPREDRSDVGWTPERGVEHQVGW